MCDQSSLYAIEKLTTEIAPTTALYFIGVLPENRLCMSSAFSQVEQNTKIASFEIESYSQLQNIVGK
jgi:hypothetical protein